LAEVKGRLDALRAVQGAGLRLLTETITSPSLAAQLEALLAEFPQAKWHQWDPTHRDNARAGALLAVGEPPEARYQFAKADVILSLDADFISHGPGNLRAVREYASRRKIAAGEHAEHGEHAKLNRLYAVESSPSLTGAVADHRLALRPSEVEGFARAVA